MTLITDIPVEVTTDIMLRLSPKELLRCVCALKSWNALISSEEFCKAYLNKSLESNKYRTLVMAEQPHPDVEREDQKEFYSAAFYPRDAFSSASRIIQPLRRPGGVCTDIVGCYDGLVCIHNERYARDLAVWNPSIQRFRRIPFTPVEVPAAAKTSPISEVRYGFGYDQSTDDYKVVRVCTFDNDRMVTVGSEVKIYSLKTRSWKMIESLSCKWFSNEAIPLSGALHWFGQLDPLSKGLRVLALHLGNEDFTEFGTPFEMLDAMSLGVLKENLCMGVYKGIVRHDIWVMKEYGVCESWEHMYTITVQVVGWGFGHLLPLALSRTGKGILMHDYCESTEGNLFWYDPDKNTGNAVQFPGMPKAFTAAVCVANMRLLDGDPVIVPRKQQVLPIKRKIGSRQILEGEGSTEEANLGDLT